MEKRNIAEELEIQYQEYLVKELFQAVVASDNDEERDDAIAFWKAKGADVSIRLSGSNRFVLHLARGEDTINKLVELGADVHAKNRWGETPIFNCRNSKYSIAALVHHGADINALDSEGRTMLFESSTGHEVYMLRDFKIDVNIISNNGETALKFHRRKKTREGVIPAIIAIGGKE